MPAEYAGPRQLDDPRSMRALAHPVRMALLEQLTFRGPLTATQCAALVDESPSSCSFHLRMLAKYGFVEEADDPATRTGRQRPWRVVTIGSRWESGPGTPPATRTAAAALSRVVRDRDNGALDAYLARQDEFEPAWSQVAIHSNFASYLTTEELGAVGEALWAIWQPYLSRLTEPTERPEGSRLVHMFAHAFPRADSLDDQPADDANDEGGDDDA